MDVCIGPAKLGMRLNSVLMGMIDLVIIGVTLVALYERRTTKVPGPLNLLFGSFLRKTIRVKF